MGCTELTISKLMKPLVVAIELGDDLPSEGS